MTAYSGDAGKTYNARNLRLKRLQADAKIVRIKIDRVRRYDALKEYSANYYRCGYQVDNAGQSLLLQE